MSDDNEKILTRLDSMDHRLAAIESSLTGNFGRRGLVGDLVDHERRIGLIERDSDRAKGIVAAIGAIAGVLGAAVVTAIKYLLTK